MVSSIMTSHDHVSSVFRIHLQNVYQNHQVFYEQRENGPSMNKWRLKDLDDVSGIVSMKIEEHDAPHLHETFQKFTDWQMKVTGNYALTQEPIMSDESDRQAANCAPT